MNERAYRHYPYPLLKYGKSIWLFYQTQHGNSSYKERAWASTSQLQSKIADVALEAESAVIASAHLPIFRKVFLLKSKNERPRKEVVAVLSFILFADLIELPPTTIKRTARIIGEAIDSDDVAGSMLARCGISDLILAESLCLVNDELHIGSAFATFLSGGNKTLELNATPKQIQDYVATSKTKAKTRKEQLDEAVREEAKKLRDEGSPILDALRKRNVE